MVDSDDLGAVVISLHTQGHDQNQRLQFNVVTADKGSSVYHEADEAHYWYEVVRGTVRTCRILADGHRQLTAFLYPEDVFGVDGPVYRESAEAVTDVVLRRYSIGSNHMLSHPLDDREAILQRALESARRSVFLFGHRTAANRIAAFLIVTAERSSMQSGVDLPMTRCDIADHLSLTLHTVSRTISEFARSGLIALDGPQKMRILDLDGLHRAAAGPDSGPGTSAYLLDESSNSTDPCVLA